MSCFLSLRNDYLAQELTALHSGALRSLAGELQRYVFSAVSIDFSKKVRNTFLANLFLAPVIGTLFAGVFQQRPLLVIGIDIAGVPLVLYAFISTCIPVIVVTVFANFICDRLQTIDDRFNFFTWHILGVSMGVLAGGLVGLILVRDVAMISIGAATGAVLGFVDAYLWWRGKRATLNVATT
jgi:hypothetical protein